MFTELKRYQREIAEFLFILFSVILVLNVDTVHLHPKADTSVGTLSAVADTANISDGDATNAPFDANNDPGNDSGPHNGIVRSFDTVTIPIKISLDPINPNATQYTVKISGYIENGISHTGGVTRDVAYVPKTGTDATDADDTGNDRTTFSQTVTTDNPNFTTYLKIKTLGAFNGTSFTPVVNVAFVGADASTSTSPASVSVGTLPTFTISSLEGLQVSSSSSNPGSNTFVSTNSDNSQTWKLNHPDVVFNLSPIKHQGTTNTVGSTFPSSMTLNRTYSASVNATGGTLAPITLNSSNLSIPTGNDGMMFTGFNGKYTENTSGGNTVQYQILNIGYPLPSADDQISNFTIQGAFNQALNTFVGYNTFTNDYAMGGPSNPNSLSNTIAFSGTDTCSYTDIAGTVHTLTDTPDLSKWNIENVPSTNQPKVLYSMMIQLGGPDDYVDPIENNNGATVQGAELKAYPMVQGYNTTPVTYNGGYQILYTFNPKSFEIDKYDQDQMAAQQNTYSYGVLKNTDSHSYSGATMFNRDLNDFTWFGSYAAAANAGTVSAVSVNNQSAFSLIGNNTNNYDFLNNMIYLHGIAPNGVTSSDGNPNNINYKIYYYTGSGTDRGTAIQLSNYTNSYDTSPTDSYINSTTLKPDNTVAQTAGNSPRFNTVQFVPAFLSLGMTNNYWPTDTPTANPASTDSIYLFPTTTSIRVSPNDSSKLYTVTMRYTLPAGMRYVLNSAHLITPSNDTYGAYFKNGYSDLGLWQQYANNANIQSEPLITNNADGTQTLLWKIPTSYAFYSPFKANRNFDNLPALQIQANFDNYYLNYTNNEFSFNTTSSNSLQENFNLDNVSPNSTSNSSGIGYPINVSLVSGPGVTSTITPSLGYPGSSFTLVTKPYTTDTYGDTDMKGIIPIPYNNDLAGSKFTANSTISITNLTTNTDGHNLQLYYTNSASAISSSTPNVNTVDTSPGNADGWTAYNGDPSTLNNAKAIYYVITDNMPNTERNVNINLTFKTSGNNPGDRYVSKSFVTSPSYAGGMPNKSTTSPSSTYQIIGASFNGKVWVDTNQNGLLDAGEAGLSGIHVHLFKYNSANDTYELAANVDSTQANGIGDGTTTDSSGDYNLVTNSPGQYKIGILKSDLAAKKMFLTTFNVGSDLTSNSHFDGSQSLVDGYYLSSDSDTIPDNSDISQFSYNFNNINAGLVDNYGSLALSVPDLYFGSHKIPKIDQVYDNINPSNSSYPADNTIRVLDTRAFAYNSYHVTVTLNNFYDTKDQSQGLQQAELKYIDGGTTIPVTINQAANLFQNLSSTPGNLVKTYQNIQLVVPHNQPANTIKSGQYQANVTYNLIDGPQ